jgi:hypothetical protein
VSNDITNYGVIEAKDGALVLARMTSNGAAGTLKAARDSTLLVRGMTANSGKITLLGGAFDNQGALFTNNGLISGYGFLSTGGLTNNGAVKLTGGSTFETTVSGNFTNAATGTVNIEYNPVLFAGNVTIEGAPATFKVTQTHVTILGTLTGSYFSDPATLTVTDIVEPAASYLLGGLGDTFIITNDFINRSQAKMSWNTREAALKFISGQDNLHHLYLAGADLGASLAGFVNNFAWGSLDLTGQKLFLLDGNGEAGGAFYVGEILGLAIDWQGKLITNVTGHGLNMYYDPSLAGNAYLMGQTFAFLDGGILAPAVVVPVPGTVWLLLTGVVGLWGGRRWRKM